MVNKLMGISCRELCGYRWRGLKTNGEAFTVVVWTGRAKGEFSRGWILKC